MAIQTRYFVLTNVDGSIQIMQIVRQEDGRWPTAQECLAKWHSTLRANVTGFQLVNAADIPQDRTFRNAWRHDGTAFSVNMPNAREVWRRRIRRVRDRLLAALDAEYLKADELGDLAAKQAIATKKQALRDAPADPAIDAAATPDDLKLVWPAALNGETEG